MAWRSEITGSLRDTLLDTLLEQGGDLQAGGRLVVAKKPESRTLRTNGKRETGNGKREGREQP